MSNKNTTEELVQKTIIDAMQTGVLDKPQEILDPNEILKSFETTGAKFPLDAFPKEIVEIIDNWTTAYKFPCDYYGPKKKDPINRRIMISLK